MYIDTARKKEKKKKKTTVLNPVVHTDREKT